MLVFFYLVEIVNEEDATALTCCFRLHYENGPFVIVIAKLSFEISPVSWQKVGSWKKVVFLWEPLRHLNEISCKVVFTGELEHSWKMVYFLVWLHFGNTFWLHTAISPKYIPVFYRRSNFTRLDK